MFVSISAAKVEKRFRMYKYFAHKDKCILLFHTSLGSLCGVAPPGRTAEQGFFVILHGSYKGAIIRFALY